MRVISVYDLDRTVLRHPTFTPFLVHCAKKGGLTKLLRLPVWIMAMAFYKLGGCSRQALKQFGLHLFLDRDVSDTELHGHALSFADSILPGWLSHPAKAAIGKDRSEGHLLVLATAAMDFYAVEIGRRLGFDYVLATRHTLSPGRGVTMCRNCYGNEKPLRVAAWLHDLGLERTACEVRFTTDSISDAPLLYWADQGTLVDAGKRGNQVARERGWATARFNR